MKEERKNGEIVNFPIILGSVSFYMGKRAPGEHSHQWTIYVRSVDGSDLSFLLDKVTFTLHPSCSQPVVVVQKPPFKVSQTGWGEFEAAITFHFKNNFENPVTNSHFLRLFPDGTTSAGPNTSTKIPVVSEIFDEFLFVNPTVSLYKHIKDHETKSKEPEKGFSDIKKWFKDYEEETKLCLQRIKEADDFICQQVIKKVDELNAMNSAKAT